VKANVLQLALLLPMLASLAICQETKLGDSCDLSLFTDRDAKSFLAFDKELREAIAKRDPVTVSMLVAFPLRINSNRGSWSIDDAAALQSHFEEIFPEPVRNAILHQDPAKIFCRDQGAMYGNGEVWVNTAKFGFAVSVINLAALQKPRSAPNQVEILCQTDSYRIVVDSDKANASRYRAWNRPHPLTGPPDLEIKGGEKSFEGTGLCAHPLWSFTNKSATYVIEGLGCTEDEPPKGAIGRFEVSVSNESKTSGWCY
jgi:hypothetical protein